MSLWQICEDAFDPKKLNTQETVFTIGNGYFGTRGAFEEGYSGSEPATLIEGVFDNIPIGKEELANAPDWLSIKLFVNGERFRLDRGKILAYERILDMQTGVLSRTVSWESPTGIALRLKIERFASLADQHVGMIRYAVTSEGQDADLELWATLNTAVGNYEVLHFEPVDQSHMDDTLHWLQTETRHSKVQLVQTMSFVTQRQDFHKAILDSDIAPSFHLKGRLTAGDTLTTEKLVVMYTSRDGVEPRATAIERHLALLNEAAPEGSGSLYDRLLARSAEAWQDYWRASDIIIEGDDEAQCAVRYSIYQLRISAPVGDKRYSIAAKGLTGFGYHGHIFHDTEIFMLPFFIYTHPQVARDLLLYRYNLLPGARAKAASNGYEGAQYPWESTLDGDEATPEAIIHPESGEIIPVLNGHIELHITSSIAYAFWRYWHVTGDDEFMRDYGAEVLLSTAAFWASRAEQHPEHNDYEINGVIGPDEWHEHVNNNAFTNSMARWNIQAGLDALAWIKQTAPRKGQELTQRLRLDEQHLQHWQDVVARMRIPRDTQTGLLEQFDGFFKLEPLDQSKYKDRTTSYQAILGMQGVQGHQIIKQADVLMLLTVLNSHFDLATKRTNWDYYYPITDHNYGSSLTPALHTILACEVGDIEAAYQLFMKGALVDLQNLRGNSPEGIHDACAGAVWQAVVFGFAGLRLDKDGPSTHPSWPDNWTRLAFNFFHAGKPISIDLHRPVS